tara:strand:+ start:308 stop:679 length:372 start_codon:yes stop_codon:yes gene_type:complete
MKKLIFLLFFVTFYIQGQEFLTAENFKDKTAKDIVAVEFWVEWNKPNEFSEFIELNDCEKYRVDIGKYPDLQEKYEVTCIPTVIIFESGEEKERFKANIMFELEATKKDVQKSIDRIMFAKFN